ncbi:TA system VapC family ribonuclease toxin [Paraconexibacter algicola]|uniref:Ribonuclease VapC n=1 Tax=Paraconexibacter algicola TaxID=2133960 RepID=A0A2T4ULC5_9ACTN|nr:TA system VapC family ribonuclease toxin [Paraconexibacter algicola]PTL60052.1 VapC toxin family PIN domain ribonuclease [Paraconexibacter algicola]
MSRALLDINVLLALLDSDHIDHRRAHEWLAENGPSGWASCAITENGFVRIISQPRYPSPVSPTVAVEVLAAACAAGHHARWPCDVSILDDTIIDRTRVHGPRQVTDAYLLALATHHQGRFVTFDHGVVLSAVRNATDEHLVVI